MFIEFKTPYFNEEDGLNISGNNSEVADPEPSDIDNIDTKGVKEPEIADPAKQSEEDNAKYAAARREAEKKAKEAEQKAAKLERDNTIARKYGAEYGVYSEADIKEKLGYNTLEDLEKAIQDQQYRDAGIDPELIDSRINNHPVVKQAQTYVQQLEQQQRQERINQDINNLHKEFPGAFDHIKEEQDIYNDPKFNDVYQWLEKGYELSDAFYKVYKNDIVNKTTQTAVKSTIANIQDKAKRGVISSGDGGDELNLTEVLSKEDVEMANAFGVNPKNVAKYVKSQLKK